ncbi:unnamed protein product [Paramecium sonneborni]|uniref:TLDc domain-containing protein n=1 Tax=Paramecium sonneborni TaxID=65129 RepID=A0A8S1RRL6_9CILI|nr:unnamed protein product [Paramecium sonneborni]
MKIPCLKHQGSDVHFIFLKEQQVDFLCDLCQTNMLDQHQQLDFSKLINIQKALKQPEYLTSKIINSEQLITFLKELYQNDDNNINLQLIEIENIIQQLQIQLTNVQIELQVLQKSYNEFRQQIRENLEYIIKFDEFKRYIDNLQQLQETINPQRISENERNLYFYFKILTKDNLQSTQNKIFNLLEYNNQYMNQENNQFNNLQELYNQFNQQSTAFKNQINPKFPKTIQNTQLITKEFQSKIIDTIIQKSKKQVKKINLIYKWYKSDLNAEKFWNNVDGQDNLLIVFSLQNDTIFGAYSPCKWIKSQNGQYVKDETLSSFLFSQKYSEIYPIKQEGQEYAIYCHTKYGPIFGGVSILSGYYFTFSSNNNDLQILSDFKVGSSNIGMAYQINSSGSLNTLPFGQSEQKIIMCEIFQVSFI